MVTEKSSHEERLQQLKAFDQSKAGVKGVVDAGITNVPPISSVQIKIPQPPATIRYLVFLEFQLWISLTSVRR
ncbi:hypothetical protein M0R45_018377 [Rubus argutus]|uniref:Uncharacterized protein n=1 Tax=Rubus argutus TaxID=59490 RepID=A0AAW1X5S9_RUBAR